MFLICFDQFCFEFAEQLRHYLTILEIMIYLVRFLVNFLVSISKAFMMNPYLETKWSVTV